jgi:hypothetical protein
MPLPLALLLLVLAAAVLAFGLQELMRPRSREAERRFQARLYKGTMIFGIFIVALTFTLMMLINRSS